jgi:hypothetical protein
MELERTIVRDEKLRFTLLSFLLVLTILVNLTSLKSPIIGISASLVYITVNAVFLAHAFFGSQELLFRLILGSLAFLMLLGFVGWLILAIYNLDIMASVLVLLIAATVSSLMNKRMKHSNA